MRRSIWSSVVCLAVLKFYTLSCKWYDFREKKKNILNTKCVFWFSVQTLSETFVILRWIRRGIVTNMDRPSCKVSVILVRCQL